jgi:hypothetical protein
MNHHNTLTARGRERLTEHGTCRRERGQDKEISLQHGNPNKHSESHLKSRATSGLQN